MTGIMPSRTSVVVRSREGLSGTIPAANERAAGCMSAEQADQLAKLWTKFATATPETLAAPTAVSAPAVDMPDIAAHIDRAIAIALQAQPAKPSEAQVIRLDQSALDRIKAIEARLSAVEVEVKQKVHDQAFPPPKPTVTIASLPAGIPINLEPPEHADGADDEDRDLPAFLRTARPVPPPIPEPPAPIPAAPSVDQERLDKLALEIETLRADVASLSDGMREIEPPADSMSTSTRDMARMDIQMAGRDRRSRSVIHGDLDPALMLNLSTTALYAKSGKEVAFTALAALAEARGVALWQDVADDLIKQYDAALQIAVRSYAVEVMALRELDNAPDDKVAIIRDAAIATIGAIGQV